MSMNDPLANVLSAILNNERIGKNECTVKPASKLIKRVLEVIKENGFIGSFDEIKDGKGNLLKIYLLGNINKCGVIKPRYNLKVADYEIFEKRYLPAKDVGIIIISTPAGIITLNEAKKKNVGGRLLAYCY